MAKHFVISLVVAVVLAQFAESKPAYQMLESRPGYIPVYIRLGNQPLDEINPLLAEAFREHEISARNIKTELEKTPDSPESSLNFGSLLPSSKTVDDLSKLLPDQSSIPDQVRGAVDKVETSDKKE